ncbi:FecR family protein [Roseateles sp. LYH14W]|uniref:FecR family protein n=1 Tax=Pelomonas parva TaxID=3299032 RepID=A0ABW7F2K6_9BURK
MDKAHDLDEQAADWVAARDGDHWSPAREQELAAWQARSTAHRVAFLRAQHTWQRADRLQVLRAGTAERQTWRARAGRWLRGGGHAGWVGAGALASVAIVGLAALLFRPDPGTQQLATGIGEKAVLALNDGSRLTLNTATRIRTEMQPAQRKVWLDDGEAYFEVAPDAKRPFVVQAGQSRITVLGTKFSVYRNGNDVRVAVIEGRVALAAGGAAPQMLARADTAAVSPGVIRVRQATAAELTAGMGWLTGQLRFDGVTLAAAAEQFNRYNRRKLLIDDPAAAAILIGGSFEAGNVEQFARLLASGFGLVVRLEADAIHVASR